MNTTREPQGVDIQKVAQCHSYTRHIHTLVNGNDWLCCCIFHKLQTSENTAQECLFVRIAKLIVTVHAQYKGHISYELQATGLLLALEPCSALANPSTSERKYLKFATFIPNEGVFTMYVGSSYECIPIRAHTVLLLLRSVCSVGYWNMVWIASVDYNIVVSAAKPIKLSKNM